MEDDLTISEIRREEEPKLPFMSSGELLHLRKEVLGRPGRPCTQERLCKQLISPSTGESISQSVLSLWEKGKRPIPMWVARRVRALAEAAMKYDDRMEKK